MTAPSSGGLAVRLQATRQQLGTTLLLPRTTGYVASWLRSQRALLLQVRGRLKEKPDSRGCVGDKAVLVPLGRSPRAAIRSAGALTHAHC